MAVFISMNEIGATEQMNGGIHPKIDPPPFDEVDLRAKIEKYLAGKGHTDSK